MEATNLRCKERNFEGTETLYKFLKGLELRLRPVRCLLWTCD